MALRRLSAGEETDDEMESIAHLRCFAAAAGILPSLRRRSVARISQAKTRQDKKSKDPDADRGDEPFHMPTGLADGLGVESLP